MNPTVNTHASESLPLNDIHLPDAIGLWPPAIGWWLLLLSAVIVLVLLYIAWQKYQKKWRYRRSALQQLQQCYQQFHNDDIDTQQALHTMLALLKRTAMTAYPLAPIASLTGKPWLALLNQQTHKPCFTGDLAQIITLLQYQADSEADIKTLYHACQQWIKYHKPQYQAKLSHEVPA